MPAGSHRQKSGALVWVLGLLSLAHRFVRKSPVMVGALLKRQGNGGLIPLGGTLAIHMAHPSAVPETLQARFGSAPSYIYLAESEPYGSLRHLGDSVRRG